MNEVANNAFCECFNIYYLYKYLHNFFWKDAGEKRSNERFLKNYVPWTTIQFPQRLKNKGTNNISSFFVVHWNWFCMITNDTRLIPAQCCQPRGWRAALLLQQNEVVMSAARRNVAIELKLPQYCGLNADVWQASLTPVAACVAARPNRTAC